MRISELAQITQVPNKTIRYYESVGLLPQSPRLNNGYRDYDEADIDRLVFIRRCRDLQIPLEQIKQLVSVQTNEDAPCQEVDEIIQDQLQKVRKTLVELKALENTLAELGQCHGDTVDHCEILQRLRSSH